MKTERQTSPRLPVAALLAGAAFIAGTIACSQPASMTGYPMHFACLQEQNGGARVACDDKAGATQTSPSRMSFFERLAARTLPKHTVQ